jgi:hypothetical protein
MIMKRLNGAGKCFLNYIPAEKREFGCLFIVRGNVRVI